MTDQTTENALVEELPVTPESELPESEVIEGESAEVIEDDDDDDGVEATPKGKRAQARIQQLVAERNAAMEWGKYWQERSTAVQAPVAPVAPAEVVKAPELKDFDYDSEKWAQAFAAHAEKVAESKAERAVEKALTGRQENEGRAQAAAQWEAKLSALAKVRPDARAVISNPTLPITSAMTEVILSSEKGAELAYHLGQNPAEAARISMMKTPAQQAAAMARLESALAARKPVVKSTSKAPAPPTPISGSAVSHVDMANMDLGDFLKMRLQGKSR